MLRSSRSGRWRSRSLAMRHKYVTRAIVLQRSPLSEAATLVTLITSDLGLIRARAEGLRKPGAKLASALQTLASCEVTLVRGKEGWRLSGALLEENWFARFSRTERLRAGRVAGLVLQLVHGETQDSLYQIFSEFLTSLPTLSEGEQDTVECLAALRILAALGLDTGAIPLSAPLEPLTPDARRAIVMRINRGIAASGL